MVGKSPKPVKECTGCMMNLGDRCKAFAHPEEKWLHRDCEGYNNEELIAKYALMNDGQGAHAKKAIRQEKAKYAHTIVKEEHKPFDRNAIPDVTKTRKHRD